MRKLFEYQTETKNTYFQMRRVAFFAIVVSTAAVIASIVTLPMLYSYVQNFQSHLIVETEFCKSRSKDMWIEVHQLQTHTQSRSKRAAGYGQPASTGYGPVVNPDTSCCSCQQGPPGNYFLMFDND